MKKILICILLLANLSSGLAFALDSHPEATVGHDPAAIDLLLSSDHDQSDDELHLNDHCCHSAAHLQGLMFSQTAPLTLSRYDGFVALSQTPTFRYIAPLLRPPIV